MSMKHLKAYYTEICQQYKEMREELREYSEYAESHVVSPEAISNLETMIAPLKENYERISGIMYLLNKPNKKEKLKNYEKRMSKFMSTLDKSNLPESVLNENDSVIKEVRDLHG